MFHVEASEPKARRKTTGKTQAARTSISGNMTKKFRVHRKFSVQSSFWLQSHCWIQVEAIIQRWEQEQDSDHSRTNNLDIVNMISLLSFMDVLECPHASDVSRSAMDGNASITYSECLTVGAMTHGRTWYDYTIEYYGRRDMGILLKLYMWFTVMLCTMMCVSKAQCRRNRSA